MSQVPQVSLVQTFTSAALCNNHPPQITITSICPSDEQEVLYLLDSTNNRILRLDLNSHSCMPVFRLTNRIVAITKLARENEFAIIATIPNGSIRIFYLSRHGCSIFCWRYSIIWISYFVWNRQSKEDLLRKKKSLKSRWAYGK